MVISCNKKFIIQKLFIEKKVSELKKITVKLSSLKKYFHSALGDLFFGFFSFYSLTSDLQYIETKRFEFPEETIFLFELAM